jgi:acyl-CoA thioesterase I
MESMQSMAGEGRGEGTSSVMAKLKAAGGIFVLMAIMLGLAVFFNPGTVSAMSRAPEPAPVVEAPAAEKTIMAFGDSLVAGQGLPLDKSFPAQLEAALKRAGHNVKVINAGVSGDTTAGGLARLDWSLQQNPDYVIVALGANDMLRATDPAATRRNLEEILKKLQAAKKPVLLAGMRSLRNMQGFFGDSYSKMYKELASEYDAVYYPFFLEGVAMEPQYNQGDGLHPNEAGVALMVENLLPAVEELLEN